MGEKYFDLSLEILKLALNNKLDTQSERTLQIIRWFPKLREIVSLNNEGLREIVSLNNERIFDLMKIFIPDSVQVQRKLIVRTKNNNILLGERIPFLPIT